MDERKKTTPTGAQGFRSLLLVQALTPFHHNLLRSALLTMIAFGNLSLGGLGPEIVIGLSTLFLVAPYVLVSIPAGRLADKIPKSLIIRHAKLAEILVAVIGGLGLILSSAPLLLTAILLAGTQAAVMGPAKFAILPELLPPRALVSGNAWVTASSTLAILLGLICGNLFALDATGRLVLATSCGGLAVLGWLISFRIPLRNPDTIGTRPDHGWRDLMLVVRDPKLAIAVFACSWFWFQGVFVTGVLPLFVAALPGQNEQFVSILLLASTIGVTLGALGARLLENSFNALWVPFTASLIIAIPVVDIGLAGSNTLRLTLDFLVSSVGTGLFAVPMGTALQTLSQPGTRGQAVGANHMANGLAMMIAGLAIAALGFARIGPAAGIVIMGVATSVVALLGLIPTLPLLYSTVHNAKRQAAST